MSSYLSRGSCPASLGAFIALLLVVVTPAAHAQRLSDLSAGTRLRVRTIDDLRWREGTLDTLTPDTLALQQPEQRLALPREFVRDAQRRGEDASRSSRAINGVLLGAVIGVLVNGGLVWADCAHHKSECGLGLVFVPAFALAGGVVGGTINASRGVERWEPVQLQ